MKNLIWRHFYRKKMTRVYWLRENWCDITAGIQKAADQYAPLTEKKKNAPPGEIPVQAVLLLLSEKAI